MGTVGKALDLLDLFTRARPQVGLSDLARLAGVNKATCYRLLTELASRGLVEQIAASREYRLGPALIRLARLRDAAVPARNAVMPLLQALARATGETAHLSQLAGGVLQTLAFAYPAQTGVAVMMDDADILPFHATASGAAVLAFLPEAEVTRILAQTSRASPVTTSADAVRSRMARVAERGWAETLSTFEQDVQGFAMPLFDDSAACIGAVAIAAAAPRQTAATQARITGALASAALEINRLWGGKVPDRLETLWRKAA